LSHVGSPTTTTTLGDINVFNENAYMKRSTHRYERKETASMVSDDERIKLTILRKMVRLGFIGGKHTSIKNLPKGFPKSERGRVANVVRKMATEYFIVKRKPDSLHVSLNPRILYKVFQEIENEEADY
jgi:hypothetical protein